MRYFLHHLDKRQTPHLNENFPHETPLPLFAQTRKLPLPRLFLNEFIYFYDYNIHGICIDFHLQYLSQTNVACPIKGLSHF